MRFSSRRLLRRLSSVSQVAESLESRTLLTAIVWDGGGDGTLWTDPNNWSPDSVPGSADDVTINVAASPVIDIRGAQSVRSLVNAETLQLHGASVGSNASLSIGTTASNTGVIECTSMNSSFSTTLGSNGGTITNEVGGTIRMLAGTAGSRAIAGNFVNNGTFEYATNALITSGSLQSFDNLGTITVASGVSGTITLSGLFKQRGTVTTTNGARYVISGGTFNFVTGSITGDALKLQNSDIDVDGATAASTIYAEGSSNVLVGLDSPNVSLFVQGNSTAGNASVHVNTAATSSGLIALDTANSSFSATIDIDLNGSLTSTGTIRSLPGSGGLRSVRIASGASLVTGLTNNGTIHATGTTNLIIDTTSATGFFTQNGQINIDAGANVTVTSAKVSYVGGANQSGLRVNSTTLDLDAAGSPSTILAYGTNSLAGHDAANLTLLVQGSSLGSTGTLNTLGNLTTTGPISLDSANSSFTAQITVAEGTTYTNAGTINALNGAGGQRLIRLGASGAAGTQFRNDGTIQISNTATMVVDGGGGGSDVFTQNGTINITPGGTLTQMNSRLNYIGGSNQSGFRVNTVDVDFDAAAAPSTVLAYGTNSLIGHDALNVTLLVQGNSLGSTGVLTVPNSVATTGPISLDSATSNFAARIDIGEGMTFTNNGTIRALVGAGGPRTIQLGGGGPAATFFVNNGTIDVAASTPAVVNGNNAAIDRFTQNGPITIAAGGSLSVQTAFLKYIGGGNQAGFQVSANTQIDLDVATSPSTVMAVGTTTLVGHDAANITLTLQGNATNSTGVMQTLGDLITTGTIVMESANSSFSERIEVAEGSTWTNNATIRARVTTGGQRTIQLGTSTASGTTFLNNGTLDAPDGAMITVQGSDDAIDKFIHNGSVTLASGGLVLAQNVLLKYIGGSNDLGLRVTASAIDLDAASVASTVLAVGSNELIGHDAANLTLLVQGNPTNSTAVLNVLGTVGNSSGIVLDGVSGFSSRISVAATAVFTNGVAGIIRVPASGSGGSRLIDVLTSGMNTGVLNNLGTIRIEGSNDLSGSGPITNAGLIEKPEAGETTFSPDLVNTSTGVVNVAAGTLRFLGTTNVGAGTFLSTGRYSVASGATLAFGTNPSLHPTVLTAEVEISGTGVADLDRLQVNRGRIALLNGADLTISPTAPLTLEGIIDLSPTSLLTINANTNLGGVSQPVVRTEIASATDFGKVMINGVLNLDSPSSTSRFDPDLVNAYDPPLNTQFNAITAGSVTNAFDSFQGGLTPSGNILSLIRPTPAIVAVKIIPGPPPPAPQILSQTFEFETREAIVFTFDQDVSAFLSRKDYQLQNLTLGQTIPNSAGSLSYNQTSNQATLTLTNQIPDGNYRLTVNASDIANSAGVPANGSPITLDFFIFRGDANRNRSINIGDFSTLASRFNLPGTYSQADFNYNGTTEIGDFSILASKFNTALAPGSLPFARPTNAFSNMMIADRSILDQLEL